MKGIRGYGPKIDRVLDACAGFTESDFAELALAAARKAGLSAREQARLESPLRIAVDAAELRRTEALVKPVTGPDGAVTGKTITDEQIHALRLSCARILANKEILAHIQNKDWERVKADFDACDAALGRVRNSRRTPGYKARARARCATAYNARQTGGAK